MKPIIFTQSDKPRVLARLGYQIDNMKPNKKYRLEMVEHREKRSRDANSYFWVLCDKLAEATGIPKTEVYRNAIREIGGVSEEYCGKPEAVDRLCEHWVQRGLGWITEMRESKMPGTKVAILYYGSSSYNTDQMRRLIDNVVQDCKALEIETETPERLAMMVEEWEQ